jgi:hypothetical protein
MNNPLPETGAGFDVPLVFYITGCYNTGKDITISERNDP